MLGESSDKFNGCRGNGKRERHSRGCGGGGLRGFQKGEREKVGRRGRSARRPRNSRAYAAARGIGSFSSAAYVYLYGTYDVGISSAAILRWQPDSCRYGADASFGDSFGDKPEVFYKRSQGAFAPLAEYGHAGISRLCRVVWLQCLRALRDDGRGSRRVLFSPALF